ncbi:MAG: flagellar biosynthetic protein FliR [Candidatus Melainabacteria bacterium RIFCSPHIGHO2_02_FULL_34_12]|nr:MAG: flagellar biosynthetic protein FliR [Candidatus Melainabacteria bacterium RIFCSPHIGHO2_02_FULL_34_12]
MFDILLSQSKILEQLGGIWIIALLVFSRSIAFASTAPLIGHKTVPAMVKVSFAILLTLLLMPNIEPPAVYPKNYYFIQQIVMNVFVGLLIGWMTSLVIEIGRVAGEMLDMQMGLNAATLFDPGTQTQSTIIGRLFDLVSLTLFISIGGMEKVIEGFSKAYNTFPVVVNEINLNFNKILSATADVISIGFIIVSPIIMIILVIDLILGIMSRAAPQINAFQISFSIKPAVGIILVFVLLPYILQILGKLLDNPNRFLY